MDTCEDIALAQAAKSALEEGMPQESPYLKEILSAAAVEAKRRRLRPLWHWGGPALLAASLVLALAIEATFSGQSSQGMAKSAVSDAICLLCELDGVSADSPSAASPGELLLAWQEAPCADLL